MTSARRLERLREAGATIDDVSGGFGVMRAEGGDYPEAAKEKAAGGDRDGVYTPRGQRSWFLDKA